MYFCVNNMYRPYFRIEHIIKAEKGKEKYETVIKVTFL